MVAAPMSKRDKSPSSELVAAAEALDAQLTRFESLADQFRKAPLNSEKNLERASKLLKDVAEQDQHLNAAVSALVAAVTKTRDRQQTQAESVNARAQDLQQRAEAFKVLLERYGALGQSAAELNGTCRTRHPARQGPEQRETRRCSASWTASTSAWERWPRRPRPSRSWARSRTSRTSAGRRLAAPAAALRAQQAAAAAQGARGRGLTGEGVSFR